MKYGTQSIWYDQQNNILWIKYSIFRKNYVWRPMKEGFGDIGIYMPHPKQFGFVYVGEL